MYWPEDHPICWDSFLKDLLNEFYDDGIERDDYDFIPKDDENDHPISSPDEPQFSPEPYCLDDSDSDESINFEPCVEVESREDAQSDAEVLECLADLLEEPEEYSEDEPSTLVQPTPTLGLEPKPVWGPSLLEREDVENCADEILDYLESLLFEEDAPEPEKEVTTETSEELESQYGIPLAREFCGVLRVRRRIRRIT